MIQFSWQGLAASLMAMLLVGSARCEPVELKSAVERQVRPLVDEGAIVGAVAGIIKDGQRHVFSFGEVELGSGSPPDENTLYEIGSITKVFTGILLADAVERGVVALDDPVQRHLPEGVTMPLARGEPVTLLHLATHTSSLPRLPSNMPTADPQNPYADYTEDLLHAFLNGHRILRPPGKYRYSNLGMGLLGQVIGYANGESYERLVIERICRPLGMDDTRIVLSEGQRARLAPPYNGSLSPEKNWDLGALAGAGALRSTCRDLLRFIECQFDDQEGRSAEAPKNDAPETDVEDRAILGRAFKGARKIHHEADGIDVGLGWHRAADGITWAHGGQTGGYSAFLAVIPSQRIGVVILSNTGSEYVAQVGENLTRVAFGLDVEPPAIRSEIDVDGRVLQAYAGEYRITPNFALTITFEDGRLMAQATGQAKYPIHAESETKFFYRVVDATITFGTDDEGNVDHLVLRQAGQELKGRRVADAADRADDD